MGPERSGTRRLPYFARKSSEAYDYNNPDWEGSAVTGTIDNLDDGTDYYFVVRAFLGSLESADSEEVHYAAPAAATVTDTDGDGLEDNIDEDDDDDGMPDTWENDYGLDSLSNDADGDLDGDGISNRDEYRTNLEPDMAGTGTPPDAAAVVSPEAGSTTSDRQPTLVAEAYADDDGDAHIATQWQIFDDTGACVMDVITDRSLSSLTVPMLLLEGSADYEWRLRYFDSGGHASAWSDLATFCTGALDNDTDGNGIPDNEEGANALATSTSDDRRTLMGINAASDETVATIVQAVLIDPLDLAADDDTPDALPDRMVAYKVYLDDVGATIQVTARLSAAASADAAWIKYDTVNGWQTLWDQAAFSDDRRSVVITIRDGGPGDADGVANGIVVDPSGLVEPNASATDGASTPASSSSSSSSGGGGGGWGWGWGWGLFYSCRQRL